MPWMTWHEITVALLLWLSGWSHHIWCVKLHFLSFVTLVAEGSCCVLYAIRRQIYWGLLYNVVFLPVLWFDITHINKDTQHTQGPKYWHTHIYSLAKDNFKRQRFDKHERCNILNNLLKKLFNTIKVKIKPNKTKQY